MALQRLFESRQIALPQLARPSHRPQNGDEHGGELASYRIGQLTGYTPSCWRVVSLIGVLAQGCGSWEDTEMEKTLEAVTPQRRGTFQLPAAAALAALGVVYGDIGTSPLYGFKQAADAASF